MTEAADALRAMLRNQEAAYERERSQTAERDAAHTAQLQAHLATAENRYVELESDLMSIIWECHSALDEALNLLSEDHFSMPARTIKARAEAALRVRGML